MTTTEIDLKAFAYSLVKHYFDIEAAQRPIDKKIARAKFDGFLYSADRLGIVPTDTALHLDLLDVIREHGERPGFHFASKNTEWHDWTNAVVDALAAKIEKGL